MISDTLIRGDGKSGWPAVTYEEVRSRRMIGLLLFLLSDVVIFGALIFTYLYLRNSANIWPPIVAHVQLPALDSRFAAVNSVVLFGSGVTMHYALQFWKRGARIPSRILIIATFFLGLLFLLGQAHEWSKLTMTWSGSTFGACFFTLTGVHGFHVFVGLCWLAGLWFQTGTTTYDTSRYFGLTAGTLYWHFVDVIWVFLLTVFYLI